MATIQVHELAALLVNQSTAHFVNKKPVWLRRGQIGTVVVDLDASTVDVGFSDGEGRTYAMLAVPREKLMLFRESPAAVAA